RIAKLIPMRPLDLTLSDALGRSARVREDAKQRKERVVDEFCQLYAEDAEARTLIDLALKLEGLTRNAGKHAGGVGTAPATLTPYAPLYREAGGTNVVTQLDKDDVEPVGQPKLGFLGLRTLTTSDWAAKPANRRRLAHDPDARPIDIAAIPLDDPAAFLIF